MKPIPIIFIHRGNSPYLAHTIGQVRRLNPQSPIYLLGDSANAGQEFVRHVDLAGLDEGAAELRRVYRHLSTNGERYERFCFERWFCLRDFMRREGLELVFHMDSDVLLYVNVDDEHRLWSDFEMTLVCGVCPGNMYLRREALEGLCEIIMSFYTNPEKYREVEAFYLDRQARGLPGGVCDMTAIKQYFLANRPRMGEMEQVIAGSTYDANIHRSDGYEMRPEGIKAIWFENDRPLGRLLSSGESVFFKSLHFQGGAKKHIEPHARQLVGQPTTTSS